MFVWQQRLQEVLEVLGVGVVGRDLIAGVLHRIAVEHCVEDRRDRTEDLNKELDQLWITYGSLTALSK